VSNQTAASAADGSSDLSISSGWKKGKNAAGEDFWRHTDGRKTYQNPDNFGTCVATVVESVPAPNAVVHAHAVCVADVEVGGVNEVHNEVLTRSQGARQMPGSGAKNKAAPSDFYDSETGTAGTGTNAHQAFATTTSAASVNGNQSGTDDPFCNVVGCILFLAFVGVPTWVAIAGLTGPSASESEVQLMCPIVTEKTGNLHNLM